jgi:protein gp37
VATSTIEWTDVTWNPVTGCDRTSPGCDNCYALTLASRLKAMGQAKYQRDGDDRTSGPGFGLTLHRDELDKPLTWRKSRMVFVNSMSDLFHPDVPIDFILDVWATMASTPQHAYQILTKRPQRMARVVRAMDGPVLPNVWLGASVETQPYADLRLPHLLATPAATRFVSLEPLLGPVQLPEDEVRELDWVIVGGESGRGARPMHVNWVRAIRDSCQRAGVAVFVKQLGAVWAAENTGRHAHGGDWSVWPNDLRVREFPAA